MAVYNYITSRGVIVSDTSSIKSDVEAEYKEVYGDDFIVDSSTEQGREIDGEISSRSLVVRKSAFLANQINPDMAEGFFLDAIYALFNGQRDSKERSTVSCVCAGIAGTIIPENSRVSDVNNNLWFATNADVIPSSGSVTVTFKSVDYGIINAGIGEVNTIVDGELGWETVTNSSQAIPGKLEQSDFSARKQMKLDLAGNAVNNTYAIITAVNKLENVSSLTYHENKTDSTEVIDGVTLVPKSNYICVDGGVDLEIATAYYRARSGGSDFNGNTTIQVTDENSLQVIDVKFDRPTYKPKLARITVKASSGIDPSNDIKQAVVDYANGLVGDNLGFVVGGNVSPVEIACAVIDQVQGIFVTKSEIAEKDITPIYTTDTIETAIFEKATIITNDVQVIAL